VFPVARFRLAAPAGAVFHPQDRYGGRFPLSAVAPSPPAVSANLRACGEGAGYFLQWQK